MTNLTERYLEAALRSIPEAKRGDVDRELRSSIADAVEERVGAGEDRRAAERAVLEGLGDPYVLASAYTGRPNFLIGPELFPLYRMFVQRGLATVVPIVGFILLAVTYADTGDLGDAIGAGISAAINVAIQIGFWTTLTFIFLERADTARQARTELVEKSGRWTVERLPEQTPGRMTTTETVSEVITALITIGGLLWVRSISVPGGSGAEIPLLAPDPTLFWYPVWIGVLLAQAVLHVIVFTVGRWTMPLAIGFTALQLSFALPAVYLALKGMLINPAFAAEIGWPPLAQGDGVVMLSVAVGATLASAWEIVNVFIRVRNGRPIGATIRAWTRSF
jgi:hypothetical protein